MIKKYVKKPVVIEAIQFIDQPERITEIFEFCKELPTLKKNPVSIDYGGKHAVLKIPTSEGVMDANIGDWIIKEPFDKERGFYPCKPDIFAETYSEVVA